MTTTTLPTRESLESMKRPDLQRLCKDYGVRANLKSEALIDLVLDVTKQSNQQTQPQRSTATGIASTRSTRHSRLRSTDSVVVHDTDEEDGMNVADEQPQSDSESKPEPRPLTRTTRKAKYTQVRLGVGRPKVAGGTGARAVTKPVSVPKSKRTSKSVNIKEAVIPEEPEHEPANNEQQIPKDSGPSESKREQTTIPSVESQPKTQITQSSMDSLDKINDYIIELVRPLHEQIQTFKFEFERHNTQVANLTSELETLRVQSHTVEERVTELERQSLISIGRLQREAKDRSRGPSSALIKDRVSGDSETKSPPLGTMFPGEAPTTLGKRHRDSFTSDITGIIDPDTQGGFTEEELAQKVVRRQKKRPKLSKDEGRLRPSVAGPSHHEAREASSGPGFTVFSGPEERSEYVDPPPPTTHLSELFGHHPPVTPGSDLRTDSASAPENHNPFGLSFSTYQAVTSTPVYGSNGLASYLQRPDSPTSHVIERAGRQDRASPFFVHAGRSEQSERLSSGQQGDVCGHENPDPMSVLLKTPPPLAVNEPGADVEIEMDVRMDDTPAPPVKRTMYGTELESDTRFGDFGVEGIATGYWQGTQRRH